MNDKISVIIPVYNVEKYLNRCLESVIKQDYTNIEIILVNDGSKDSSGNICDEYAKKDDRIKIIHKNNGGLSEARNFGIKKATGSYITFIDSDDCVENDYISYLYNLIIKNDAQISVCAYKAKYDNGTVLTQENGKEFVLNSHDAIEKTLYHEDFNSSTWAKMYKTSFFEDIEFPVGKLFEDVATTYKLFFKADKIAVGLKSKYNYMIRENSILTSEFSEKKLYLVDTYKIMGEEILKKYDDLKDAVIRANVYANISTLRQMIYCKPRLKNKEKEISNYVKENYKVVLKNKRVAKRDKIACILIKINNKLFKYGWLFYCKATGRKFN